MSVVVALLLFSFSHNRVEGIGAWQLSGLLMLGLFVPFFLPVGWQYLSAPAVLLGGKALHERNFLFLPPLWSHLCCGSGAVPGKWTGSWEDRYVKWTGLSQSLRKPAIVSVLFLGQPRSDFRFRRLVGSSLLGSCTRPRPRRPMR
jgi:hypothetical protein